MQETTPDELQRIFDVQRASFLRDPMPVYESRIKMIDALKSSLLRRQEEICRAISEDFGHRSRMDTLLSDIVPVLMALKHARKRLKKWMRPQRRNAGWLLMPASLRVTFQPKGVVGIVVPWNFPITLSLGPLIGALAAGDRSMIKMSEKTPRTNAIVRTLLADFADETQVAVIHGQLEIAKTFTALPFDHLLFTGSTAVGRKVMKAAAENLTPVTLELGGKSPLIVGPDIDISVAAGRALFGKCVNAAQICVAPDYVLLPRPQVDAFVKAASEQFKKFYADGVASQDYTSVVDSVQYERLLRLMEDAKAKGARIIPACENARDDEKRRMATHFVLDVTEQMSLMQEEIFGPLLPLLPYDDIDDALAFIRRRPRPLAMYLMSFDKSLQLKVVEQTHAGGMTINDTMLHVAADDAPFGGIGESGMGRYHGREGFLAFSNAKTVFRRGRIDAGRLLHPPYGRWWQRLLLKWVLR